jgi:CBS domain containing-hemolysin-like protein
MSVGVALGVSALLVALSAFFVAIEFALVAARRYRLEEAAATSAAARAALRSAKDLSLLLAGSQLGITLCTVGLGAVGKPAVEELLHPLFTDLGDPWAYVVSFVLSLVVVTFVHLVVGEMAPKSWAIAHPERSATLLALPMRAFMMLTRPVLVGLNGMANWCLRRVGVEPVDEIAGGRTSDDLRELVEHSATAGALAVPAATTAGELMRPVRTLAADLPIHDALSAMQAERSQIALVASGGEVVGLVTLHDLLDRLLPAPA